MNKSKIEGKNILFIGYIYFYYHHYLIKALQDNGAIVTFHSVEKNDLWYTLSRKISHKLFMNYNNKYSEKILKQIRNKTFDYILVFHGFQLPDSFYVKLKDLNKDAKFINYTWDSVRETLQKNTILDILPHFNIAYSFDKNDCDIYKKQKYWPLFYIDDYFKLREDKTTKTIDLLFIGTLCTYNRYNSLIKFNKYCKEKNIKLYSYVKVSYRFYIACLLKGHKLKNVRFIPLKTGKIIELLKKSRAVVDLPQQMQSGLSMRIMESIGANKKILTTNINIKKETFFNPHNIQIIDLENIKINNDFLTKNYIADSSIDAYYIKNWVLHLFSEV